MYEAFLKYREVLPVNQDNNLSIIEIMEDQKIWEANDRDMILDSILELKHISK